MRKRINSPQVRGVEMTKQLLAVLIFAGLSATAQAEDEPRPDYLFDVINKPDYEKKWTSLFEGEVDLPKWLIEYPITHNGVVTPVVVMKEDDFVLEQYKVCEPHNCWGSSFVFAVSKTCPLAFGVLTSFDEVSRELGVKLKRHHETKPMYEMAEFAALCASSPQENATY
jgi:hypothetical protein